MSAQGGPPDASGRDLQQVIVALTRSMDELSRTVKDSTRASGGSGGAAPGSGGAAGARGSTANGVGLGAIGMAVGGPVGAAIGSFVDNAAFKAGKEFATDTAMGVAGDFAKFGFGAKGVSFSDSVTSSALRAGGSIPIIGDLFEQVTQPLDAAAGRTAGITGAIARAGGKVDPEMRKALFERFNQEEIRGRDENLEVEKLKKGDAEARGAAFEGTRLQEGIDSLGDALKGLAEFVSNPGAWLAGAIFGGGSR